MQFHFLAVLSLVKFNVSCSDLLNCLFLLRGRKMAASMEQDLLKNGKEGPISGRVITGPQV